MTLNCGESHYFAQHFIFLSHPCLKSNMLVSAIQLYNKAHSMLKDSIICEFNFPQQTFEKKGGRSHVSDIQ